MITRLSLRLALLMTVGLVLLSIAGCSGSGKKTGETYNVEIDPANFVGKIDNPYYPLSPGTTFVYEGKTEDGLEHTETSVTHETKVILGVTCVEVNDKVTVDGQLKEETLDWYAQDKEGNVWYFGEDTKEYENGKVSSTQGSWEAGVDSAQPGIIMKANPQVGESYRQEYYKGEAEDMAEITSMTGSNSVPFGSFDNLLVTKEWTPLEPDIVANKYYSKGVGLILEETVKGGSERVELIDIQNK